MEYGYPERRKTKGDKREKRRYNKYKTGGRERTAIATYSERKESKGGEN